MPTFTHSIDINAPPERVWAVMRDIERWPEWTPTVTTAERLDSSPLGVGSRFRIVQPKIQPFEWRITRLEEGRGFAWETRSTGLHITAGHWVEPRGAGSQLTLSLNFGGFLGPIVGRLARKLNEEYVSIEAKGLKARAEADG